MIISHESAYANIILVAAQQMWVPWDACWRLVQDANMRKVRAAPDGSNSTRGSSMDVVKPAGWIAPDADMARLLMSSGWVMPEHLKLDHGTGKIIDLSHTS